LEKQIVAKTKSPGSCFLCGLRLVDCRRNFRLASGQQAIEKWFALQVASSPGEFGGKLVQVYPIGSEISAISEWSWGQWKGRQAMIYVRDADTWKIRMEYLVN